MSTGVPQVQEYHKYQVYQVYQVYQKDQDQISGATYISDVVFKYKKFSAASASGFILNWQNSSFLRFLLYRNYEFVFR